MFLKNVCPNVFLVYSLVAQAATNCNTRFFECKL